MKKNILTAIAALIVSLMLFVMISADSGLIAAETNIMKTEQVNATVIENNIPSNIVEEKFDGKIFTADIIELKEIQTEKTTETPTKPSNKPNKPLTEITTSAKEETTTQINTEIQTEEITQNTSSDSSWAKKEAEYPVATYIWRYMKNLGWSDAVCAGIMGNIMAEVGGQTLNIQPYLYSSGGSYYGICQWYLPYTTRNIAGAGLETQCNYLRDTIKREMNTFGYKYSSYMNYSNFLTLSSPSEAALAFAKCYERCSSSYYGVRQTNAQKAYNYFVG